MLHSQKKKKGALATAIQHKSEQLQRQLLCIMKALFYIMCTSCFILNFQWHFSLFVFISKFFQFLSSTLFFPRCCTGQRTNVFRIDNKQCFEWIKRRKDTKKRTDISLIRSWATKALKTLFRFSKSY